MSRRNPDFRERKYIDTTQVGAFLDAVEETVGVDSLVLFGSRATDEALSSSDYDIAVISDDFEGMPKYARIVLLLGLWDAETALEVVAFTRREFDSAKGLLAWDILEDGVVFKDTGVFADRKARHENEKARGELTKVEKGWKFAV